MMSEQRIYQELCHYYAEKHNQPYDAASFMVIAATETEHEARVAVVLVDPDMPERIDGIPYDWPICQQTLVYARDLIRPLLEQLSELTIKLHAAAETLGKETMDRIIAEASNFGEFQEKVLAEIEKHGTG